MEESVPQHDEEKYVKSMKEYVESGHYDVEERIGEIDFAVSVFKKALRKGYLGSFRGFADEIITPIRDRTWEECCRTLKKIIDTDNEKNKLEFEEIHKELIKDFEKSIVRMREEKEKNP